MELDKLENLSKKYNISNEFKRTGAFSYSSSDDENQNLSRKKEKSIQKKQNPNHQNFRKSRHGDRDSQKKHKKKHKKHKDKSRSRRKSRSRSNRRNNRKNSWSSSKSQNRSPSDQPRRKSPTNEIQNSKESPNQGKNQEKNVQQEREQRPIKDNFPDQTLNFRDERKKEINKRIFLRHYNQQIAGMENNNFINDIEAHNTLYWDGFQWVARDLTASTKDMRTIQIIGLPLDKVDFNEYQLAQFIVVFMNKYCLAEHNNSFPVRSCKITKENRSASIELTSIDEANRLKLVGKINILDRECRLTKVQETNNNIYNFSSQLEGAQRAAIAQAAALQAMQFVQKDITDKKKEQNIERKKQQESEDPNKVQPPQAPKE